MRGGSLSIGDPRFEPFGQYSERGLLGGRHPLMPELGAIPLTYDADLFPIVPVASAPVIEPAAQGMPSTGEMSALHIDQQPAASADDLVAALRQTAPGALPDHAALAEWRRLNLNPVPESSPLIMATGPTEASSETLLADESAAKKQDSPTTVKMDQIFASMVQEMAGFGADGAFDRTTFKRDGAASFDFFA